MNSPNLPTHAFGSTLCCHLFFSRIGDAVTGRDFNKDWLIQLNRLERTKPVCHNSAAVLDRQRCGVLFHCLIACGCGSPSSEYMPRLIKNLEGRKINKVSAGMLHSACIDEQGSVFTFGEKAADVLGFSEGKKVSEPYAVEKLPRSVEVACGGYHTCVVTNDGELYAWGSNENGCLGLGCTDVIRLPQMVESSFLKAPVYEVSCGWKHTAVVSDGNIFTWGWGGANGTFFEEGHSSGGQLGHGNDFDYSLPMVLDLGRNVQALHVSCGFNHSGGIFEYSEN